MTKLLDRTGFLGLGRSLAMGHLFAKASDGAELVLLFEAQEYLRIPYTARFANSRCCSVAPTDACYVFEENISSSGERLRDLARVSELSSVGTQQERKTSSLARL